MGRTWGGGLKAILRGPMARDGETVAHYRAVLDRNPTDFTGLYVVLRELGAAGRDAEALEVAGRALERDPHHLLALGTAACLAVRLGRYDEAKGYTERVLLADPEIRPESPPFRLLDGLFHLVWWAGRLVRPTRACKRPPDPPSWRAACELEEWKVWGRRYLAWHASASGPGEDDVRAIEQRDAADEACKEGGR